MLISVKCLKFAPKWPISYFKLILAAMFVTLATVKVKSISEFYTLATALISSLKETPESKFYLFDLKGGPK